MSPAARVVYAAGVSTASADPGRIPFPSWAHEGWPYLLLAVGLVLIGSCFVPEEETTDAAGLELDRVGRVAQRKG